MSSSNDETGVPLSILLIAMGIIIVGTAVVVAFILRQPIPQIVEIVPTVPLPPTQIPETAVSDTNTETEANTTALLPETPLEAEEYPLHYVNALEAAQPNNGQPVRLVIPQIDLDAPISPIGLQAFEQNNETVFQWQVPSEFKAGWHHSSAKIGASGNTVLNGHHNIYGEVFKDIDELEEGDEITLYDPFTSFTYVVSDVLILEEKDQPLETRLENAQWIEPTDDERLTLVTCWPYTDNTHRLIVVAHRVNVDDS